MDDKTLNVDAPLPLSTQAHTLWHETIHAFAYITGREHFDDRSES